MLQRWDIGGTHVIITLDGRTVKVILDMMPGSKIIQ